MILNSHDTLHSSCVARICHTDETFKVIKTSCSSLFPKLIGKRLRWRSRHHSRRDCGNLRATLMSLAKVAREQMLWIMLVTLSDATVPPEKRIPSKPVNSIKAFRPHRRHQAHRVARVARHTRKSPTYLARTSDRRRSSRPMRIPSSSFHKTADVQRDLTLAWLIRFREFIRRSISRRIVTTRNVTSCPTHWLLWRHVWRVSVTNRTLITCWPSRANARQVRAHRQPISTALVISMLRCRTTIWKKSRQMWLLARPVKSSRMSLRHSHNKRRIDWRRLENVIAQIQRPPQMSIPTMTSRTIMDSTHDHRCGVSSPDLAQQMRFCNKCRISSLKRHPMWVIYWSMSVRSTVFIYIYTLSCVIRLL